MTKEEKAIYDKARYISNKDKFLSEARERYRKNKKLGKIKPKKDPQKYKAYMLEYCKSVEYYEKYYMNKYGISYQQFLIMENNQDKKCYLCGKEETILDPRHNTPRKLCVDHCHTTGVVRKLLCGSCNRALGLFNDDIQLIEKAVQYIKEHSDAN